jgi:integrase
MLKRMSRNNLLLVKLLPGCQSRTAGDVSVLGIDPARAGRDWRTRIGVVLQESEPEAELTLRKALADAVDVEQLLAANPAARSKRPKSSAVEPVQVWTPEQLGSFLAAARSHRLFAFYRLAAYTGARRGELLYLRWSAADLDAAEVTFGGSTAVVRGQRVEGTTKGGRSRTISLDRETVAVPRELINSSVCAAQSGGQGRGRTADLPLFRRTLVPTELPDQDGCPPPNRTSGELLPS